MHQLIEAELSINAKPKQILFNCIYLLSEVEREKKKQKHRNTYLTRHVGKLKDEQSGVKNGEHVMVGHERNKAGLLASYKQTIEQKMVNCV